MVGGTGVWRVDGVAVAPNQISCRLTINDFSIIIYVTKNEIIVTEGEYAKSVLRL